MRKKYIIPAICVAMAISTVPVYAAAPEQTIEESFQEGESADFAEGEPVEVNETENTPAPEPSAETHEESEREGDEQEYIESVSTKLSAESPCQVNLRAVLPEKFGLSVYGILMNEGSGQMYRLTLYAQNGYVDRAYVPAGDYLITDLHVYDDTTGLYEFTVTSNNHAGDNDYRIHLTDTESADVNFTLVNFDEVEAQIQGKVAMQEENEEKKEETLSLFSSPDPMEEEKETPKSDFIVKHTGTGTGYLSVMGMDNQRKEYNLIVTITNSGGLGAGVFTYSLDAGKNTSDPILIPLSGIYAIPSSGLTLNFTVSAEENPGFQSGDTYACYIPDPKSILDITHEGNGNVGLSAEAIKEGEHVFDLLYAKKAGIRLEILKKGTLGSDNQDETAVYRISTDSGKSWSDELYMPKDGVITLEDLGIKLVLSHETSSFSASGVLNAGDVYTITAAMEGENNALLIFALAGIALIILLALYIRRMARLIPSEDIYRLNTYKPSRTEKDPVKAEKKERKDRKEKKHEKNR